MSAVNGIVAVDPSLNRKCTSSHRTPHRSTSFQHRPLGNSSDMDVEQG
jgi:hypothetical protein